VPPSVPTTEIDARFSSPGASPTPWADALAQLDTAEIFWLTTVRPDGRPHVTPLIAVWVDNALHFCTGETEQKAKNLVSNPNCILTTGCNAYHQGLDLVLEGTAVPVIAEDRLQIIADRYRSKYGWEFTVQDGRFRGGEGNVAIVYEVAPDVAFGFGKGDTFSQTRWSF
jgi:hypothetical protein